MQVMAAAPAERKGVKLAGVVVLSDGRDNAHPNDADYIKRFAGGAPVYPVLVGSERRPKDLSIANLDYPPTVFQNDKPILKATIRTSGLEGQEVAVLLENLDPDGQTVGEPIRKTIKAREPSQEVQFDLTAETEGRQRYRIRTDELPGETSSENNSREFAMQVVDDRSDVLLIEGEGRWEFRYLHAALSRRACPPRRGDVQPTLYGRVARHVLSESLVRQGTERPVEDNPVRGVRSGDCR